MLIVNSLATFGRYCLFIKRAFSLPDRWGVSARRTIDEVMKLGVASIPLGNNNFTLHRRRYSHTDAA